MFRRLISKPTTTAVPPGEASATDSHASVHWADNHEADFHYVWLSDVYSGYPTIYLHKDLRPIELVMENEKSYSPPFA